MNPSDTASIRPILLVDDEPGLLEATRIRIERALPGVPIRSFVDGNIALAETEDLSPGLAILDVDMPAISGLDLAVQLRNRWPDLPVLFLTGTAKENMLSEFERVGAVAWFRKPVSGQTLLDAILEHALR